MQFLIACREFQIVDKSTGRRDKGRYLWCCMLTKVGTVLLLTFLRLSAAPLALLKEAASGKRCLTALNPPPNCCKVFSHACMQVM